MPKVTISDSKGLVQTSGAGLEINTTAAFSTFPTVSVNAKTATGTVAAPGVYTVSGSGAGITLTMPLASTVPGGIFVLRDVSGHAHVLTGSLETGGTKVFAGMAGATPANSGAKLTFPGTLGTSVALISDGKSFLVSAASGSFTLGEA